MVSSYDKKEVLDIMSGRGENLYFIDSRKFETSITTLDYSNCMNALSRKKQSNKIFEQIDLDFFDFEPSKNFDVILCSFGVKTIPKEQLKNFAEKLNAILSKNGEILLLELNTPKNSLIRSLMKTYLFRILPFLFGKKFKALYPYIEKHKNFNELRKYLVATDLTEVKYKMDFFSFETLHLKKIQS